MNFRKGQIKGSLLQFLFLLLMPVVVHAQFNYTTNFTYITNNTTITTNGTIAITRYTGSNSIVVIPSETNDYPVTSIGYGTFLGIYIVTNVTIPDSVTSIGVQAFSQCSGLTNIIIPASVTNIGIAAFQECLNLTNIAVDPNNIAYTNVAGVLFDKNVSTLIEYPGGLTGSYIIPDSVSTIGDQAFFGLRSLTNVTIPDSVGTIGGDAFFGCTGFTNIIIPASVTNIEAAALQDCLNLTTITVDPLNPSYSSAGGVLFDKNQTTLLLYPGGASPNYVIPDGVNTISDSAFQFSSLNSVTIPNSVTSIGVNSFSQCGLTNVIIPDSVTTIGAAAFAECSNLTNVVMPDNLTSMGEYMLFNCPNLSSVYFDGNAPGSDSFQFDTGPTLFESDNNLTLYYLPNTTGWDIFSELTDVPIALWFPQIQTGDGNFGIQTNQFGFNVNWASGQTVIVEACTNLSNPDWQPIQTNLLTSNSMYFSDPQWTNYPARFYCIFSQ